MRTVTITCDVCGIILYKYYFECDALVGGKLIDKELCIKCMRVLVREIAFRGDLQNLHIIQMYAPQA